MGGMSTGTRNTPRFYIVGGAAIGYFSEIGACGKCNPKSFSDMLSVVPRRLRIDDQHVFLDGVFGITAAKVVGIR